MTTETLTLEVQQPPRPAPAPTPTIYWTSDLLFYSAGKAWVTVFIPTEKARQAGLDGESKSFSLGSEADVKQALSTGITPTTIWGVPRWILYEMIMNREETESGEYKTVSNKFQAVRRGNKRIRPMHAVKHQSPHPGRAKGFQKVSIRTFEQDKPMLFGE